MTKPRLPTAYLVFALTGTLGIAPGVHGEEGSSRSVDFQRDIEPIFKARCLKCHGEKEPEGGLRLTSRTNALQLNDSGLAAVVPNSSRESELIRRISSRDEAERMPPVGDPLTMAEIAALRAWIDQGAVWPEPQGRQAHWAYAAPRRPERPRVVAGDWPNNALDAFVLARLEREGMQPSAAADRAVLLRRVSLDLIGLPPTVEEVDAFLSDTRPDAYERVVDRLLSSPRYGEHWARQWLDLARYADSNGYQADQFRSMWAYRDWVIDALNRDLPFDQFTVEQLAGDLLPGATVSQKIATGFHRCTTCNVEAGVDPEENRVNQLVDRVNTTGTVWLGTTLECAQCHNHKYDPFTQHDYYQLMAYFNNTPLEVKLTSGVTFDFVGPKMSLPLPDADERRRQHVQALAGELQAQLDERTRVLKARQAEWEASIVQAEPAQKELPDDIAAILSMAADDRSRKQQTQLTEFYLSRDLEIQRLREELDASRQELAALEPPTTLVMVELEEPRPTHIFKRGIFLDKGPVVTPAPPAVLHALPAGSPANRLGLARWLVDRRNPLVARVTVNRWWAEFFGRGIVETLEDFGTQGEVPTHPELLDWLAVEFMDSGWSMKHIHKQIVTSATYQQASHVTLALLQRDPNNELLARGPRFRLPAETIRDTALSISGLLGTKMGGPPVFPPQPDGIWRHIGRNAPKYTTSGGEDRFRRGVYVVWRRSAPYPSFVNFDAPDRAACVVQRSRTNTPLQALTLLNDPAYIEMAGGLAARIVREKPDASVAERVAFAWRLCTSREPKPEEVRHLQEVFFREFSRLQRDSASARALVKQFPGAAPGSAEELAAWFFLANILLNLDETITKG